ncbi:MAG: hypothetical protein R6U69_00540, partial [Marinobacter sp.]|uniref:hypothetical protein n=1 Tax=Marinobacter sp. TaxID=50741 RepID=UPI0039767378
NLVPLTKTLPKPVTAPTLVPEDPSAEELLDPPPPHAANEPATTPVMASFIAFAKGLRFIVLLLLVCSKPTPFRDRPDCFGIYFPNLYLGTYSHFYGLSSFYT